MGRTVRVEFGGGMETLTKKAVTELTVQPPDTIITMADFLAWVRDECVEKHKAELFMQGDTIRPGVLVLINDVDWEVEGGETYTIQDGDQIGFISTLHGG